MKGSLALMMPASPGALPAWAQQPHTAHLTAVALSVIRQSRQWPCPLSGSGFCKAWQFTGQLVDVDRGCLEAGVAWQVDVRH